MKGANKRMLVNNVVLDYDIRFKALKFCSIYEGEPEMTEFESAYLCGLINEIKPKKVVEIGVAAGGTTAIVLEALESNAIQSQLISIDISNEFYKNRELSTGFMAQEYVKNRNLRVVKHKLLLGKGVIDQLTEI